MVISREELPGIESVLKQEANRTTQYRDGGRKVGRPLLYCRLSPTSLEDDIREVQEIMHKPKKKTRKMKSQSMT